MSSPVASVAVVLAAHALVGQVRLRTALSRLRAAPERAVADRARDASRALYPVPLLALPAFVLCVHLATPGGRIAGVQSAVLLAAGTVGLLVLAFLPFLQLRARVSPGTGARGAAAAMARSAVTMALVYAVGIGCSVGAVVVAASAFPGISAWARAAISAVGVMAGMVVIFVGYPFLVRVLHRGRRLDDPDLSVRLERLRETSGMAIGPVYRVPSPDNVANAMVSGVLPGARYIFVTEALLREATPDEVMAIIAHEMAHIKHRHLVSRLVWSAPGILAGALLMAGTGYALHRLKLDGGPVPVVVTAMASWLLLNLLSTLPSARRDEREADRTAAQWVGRDLYASALRRLYSANKASSELNRIEGVLSTHPSLRERLDSL
jgi:STE24 endopeptidase